MNDWRGLRSVLALAVALALLPTRGRLEANALAEDPGVTRGVRQVDEGDFEGAVETLGAVADRLAAARTPEASRACLYLGIAHLALDQGEPARRRFGQALDLDPSLRLAADRFSPKVIGALEAARREREAAARSAAPAGPTPPMTKTGHGGRTLLIAGGAVAAGTGVALVLGRSDPGSTGGTVTFTGARFGTPVLDCPNDTAGVPLAVAIDLDAQNGTGHDVAISAVSAVLIIVASPVVPAEIEFASAAPATVVPATLRPGTTALRVQTTLTCANGAGDASRYNEWKGRVTLTAGNAKTVETADTMRVNLP